MTRRMIPLGAGYFAGLFATFYLCVNGLLGRAGFIVLTVCALFLGFLSLVFKMKFRARVMLFCSAFAAATVCSVVYACTRLWPLEALDGSEAEISGRIISYTEDDLSAVVIKGSIDGIPAKSVIYVGGFSGRCGDFVRLTARVGKIKDTPFFRAREYYLSGGILLSGTAIGDVNITRSGQTAIAALREYSRKVSLNIRRSVGGEAGELLSALLTGDRSSFSDGLRLKLNRSGTAHLAAVSGLHVTVVSLFVVTILKRLKAPRWLSAAVTIAFVTAFIVFSGARVSAIRAGIMTAISVASALAKRRTDAFNMICICAVAMTIFNPFAAADSSLCLSLAGVFGVSVAAPAIIKEFGIKAKFLRAGVVSLCASTVTAPFVMLWFNEISLVSPITNIAAVPLCSAALVLGMIYAATLSVFTPIIKLAGIFCGAAVKLSEAVSSLGFTYIPLGTRIVGTAAMCGAAFTAASYLITKKPRVCAFAAALCTALVMTVYGVRTVSAVKNLYLTVMSRSDYQALVLRKGGECIIIDFDGRMSSETENVIERFGVSDIRAVVLLDGTDSGYSAYLSLNPDAVYCYGGAYVFGEEVPQYGIYGGSSAEIFGAELLFEKDCVKIFCNEKNTTVCKGRAADGDGLCISLLDGLTVINDGEDTEIFRDGFIKEFRM